MNPITSFDKVLAVVPKELKLVVQNWRSTPVFVDEEVDQSEGTVAPVKLDDPEILRLIVTKGSNHYNLPFPAMRVFIPAGKLPAFWHFIYSERWGVRLLTYVDDDNKYWEYRAGYLVPHFEGDEPKDAIFQFKQMLSGLGSKEVIDYRTGDYPKLRSRFDYNTDHFLPYVGSLAYRFMVPSIHVATVHPSTQGKSVEWINRRTRIVMLHKSCSMNRKGATSRDLVSERELTRVAHSRRAHTRLLSSPRFKNKVGKRVHVRSSWVGPHSWEDSSGQVYRILKQSTTKTKTNAKNN